MRKVKVKESLTQRDISKLTSILLEELKDTRFTEVTQHDPEHFYSSINDSMQEGRYKMLIAYEENQILGSVILEYFKADSVKHIINISKLLISKEFRNQGLAKELFGEIDVLIENSDVRILRLSVREDNEYMIKLCLRQDYEIWGRATKENLINGNYYDQLYFEKHSF